VSDRGVVFDLGYAPHEGPRLGTSAAIRATIKDGVRRVLGLRRKARKKIGPWLLFAGSLIPAIVFVGLAFFWDQFDPTGGSSGDSPFGGHVEYFSLNGTLVLIFAALAGPELLIPDRVEGVLSVYASRPMRARDYLMARAGALAVVLSGFLLVPQLLLYLGLSALDADGFFSALVNRSDDLVQIVLTSLVYMAGYGAPALLIASFARRNAPATGIYFAVMFILSGFAQGMLEGDVAFAEWVSLAALAQHPEVVRDWIFDRSSQDLAPVDAGWDPWVSLAVIVGVVIVTVIVASRRYRREM
jgi:ABC-2 type transport system permease protein